MKKLKKRKALWHKHRDYLQNEVLRLVNKANRGVQPERRVTYAAAIEVANRAIKRNGNVFSSARAFGALRAVNAFIEFATRGKDVVDAYKYADLLPVGHPSSTRSHSMTASALRHARARWYAADPLVDDELRPLVASAHAADYLSPERDYLFARLAAAPRSSLPLWLTLDVAEAIVAGALSFIGGNSSAARRARAQLQRRDRRGRFAFMGGGFSWGIKLGNTFRSLSGRVVGASGDDDVEIEVVGDPDLPDGIYALPAKRGEGVKAIIKPKKGAKATKIAVDKDAVDASTLVRKDAPSGWEAVKPKDAQKLLPSAAKLWRSADGYFVEETPEGDKVLRRIDLATNKPGNEVVRSKSWADITKGALDDQDDFAKFIEAEAAKERAGAGEAVDLDPAKNITQQVSDAVSSGKKVRFSYGGKERIITPEKISTGEKSGKRNLLGKDTDGNTKSFTLDKIEAPGAPGEQPEAPVNVPDNAVQFDPTGDLDAQLQQAIDNDAPVVFDYNGKTRVVFPQATKDGKPSYYTNPKNGNVNIIGNEAGSEKTKQFTLSKISKAGGGGGTPPPPPKAPPTPGGAPEPEPTPIKEYVGSGDLGQILNDLYDVNAIAINDGVRPDGTIDQEEAESIVSMEDDEDSRRITMRRLNSYVQYVDKESGIKVGTKIELADGTSVTLEANPEGRSPEWVARDADGNVVGEPVDSSDDVSTIARALKDGLEGTDEDRTPGPGEPRTPEGGVEAANALPDDATPSEFFETWTRGMTPGQTGKQVKDASPSNAEWFGKAMSDDAEIWDSDNNGDSYIGKQDGVWGSWAPTSDGGVFIPLDEDIEGPGWGLKENGEDATWRDAREYFKGNRPNDSIFVETQMFFPAEPEGDDEDLTPGPGEPRTPEELVESVAEAVFNDVRKFPDAETMTSSELRSFVETYADENGLSPAQVKQVAERVNELIKTSPPLARPSFTLEQENDGEKEIVETLTDMINDLEGMEDRASIVFETRAWVGYEEAIFPEFVDDMMADEIEEGEDPAKSSESARYAAVNKHRERLNSIQKVVGEMVATDDEDDARAVVAELKKFLAELTGESDYDKYIADLREEARQQWEDMTPAERSDWRRDATEDGYYVGAGSTFDEQEKIYIDMFIEGEATPRAEWEAQQDEGPLGREVAPARLTPDQEEIAWEGGSILLDNFDRDNAKRSLEAGFNDEENGGVYRRMAELIDEMGVAHDNSDWSGFIEKLRKYDELGADYTLLPSYVGDTRESVGRLLSVIDFDPDDAAIDAADEVFANGDTDAARAEAIKKIEDMLPSASQLRKFTEALDAVLDEKRRDDRSDEEIDQLAGDVVSGTPEGYDWREDPDGTVEDLIDAIADDQDLTPTQKDKMSRAVDVLLAGRDRDTVRREGGTFDREGFSRGQRRDWYIPEEGDGESIRLDADEVDGFYEIFSAPRGMYGARREMDIFRNGGQDAQEEEFDELFDSIEEAQEFVENQLKDLREGERQAERMVEEAAESPGDAEFDEMFTAPEGAYKPRIFDLYTPRGRTTEDADDYTDDPAVLANKFDAATLGRALKGAVLPDGRQAADGEGLLPFDGGDEMVPAEALYEALQQKGLDADMLLAGMYDSLLDEPVNMDKVKQMREDMGVGPDEAPALTPTAGRDRDEAVRLNQEVAAPTRARRARELMADYEERNAKVTELAQAINDLEDGVTDEVGADDFTRAEFLSRILPWSQGTAEERDAFKGLWGLLQNLGGGDVEEGTALDVPGGGELESFEGIMTRALEAAFPDRDGREMLDELYDEYGGFADFVDGKSRIADGTDDLDSGSVAASFYRLTRAAARPNRVRLQRTIGVVPGSQLQATYTTPGEVFDMDARSFTSRDLTSEDLLSSMQFAPDSGLTQVVFVAAPGEADSFNASGISWFGEGEHIGYGTYEVVSVKKVRDLLNPKRDKFAVEVRKARQRDERDIFEDATPDVSDWQMVGGQAGSNEGGFYRDSDGNEYYVKVPKSQAHAENEALAAALYELTGTPAARTILGEDNGETRIVSPLIPGAINELRDRLDDEDYIKQLRDGFVVDAWLANWDVAGLMFDNVMSDEDGNPVRVDPGGALMFRARGSEKGSNFGDRVGELDTLRDRDLNPQNSMVFGGVTDAELADQANRLRAIDPEAVDAVVDSIVTDPEMASTLKTRLRNRRADIIRRVLGVDESDRDKPVATTTESVASRDLQAGDILNDGSFVVESAFIDDETPDGMVSVQGYYPGGQSQRLNFSADDLNDVARGGKTPPKGDLEPLHRPEVAPDATPQEVEAWRDALARFEVDKAVRAAMNCGGSGLTAAVGPENGPCSVPSVDELIKKASANPGDKAPQELPDKDGVDVNSEQVEKALKDAKKSVKETLGIIEEDDEVKPVIKKRAKKFVDTFNAIVADYSAGKLDANEAAEKIKSIVPEADRTNDDIDFIATELDNAADVLTGEAFKPKQEEGMPPPGTINPKTGKPLGMAKDGVTPIRPGMLVRDKNGFAGVVVRYANPGTADPKSSWHGVWVINAIDGKQYNKVTWQLTPINPGDDDSIYIEGPDGYTGHKKKGTVIPKGSIKKGFKDWDKKAKDFHEKVAEEGKVPKASAPEGASEPETKPEAPEAPEAPAAKPIPATFDEITDEKERDLISEIVASFEQVVALSPGKTSLRRLQEKLADGEATLNDVVRQMSDELDDVSSTFLAKATKNLGKGDTMKTQVENALATVEQLEGLGSVFVGEGAPNLPPIDILDIDPGDKNELLPNEFDIEEKATTKYEGLATLARVLSRKSTTVPMEDGSRATFEDVADTLAKSKNSLSSVPIVDTVPGFVAAVELSLRRVIGSDPMMAVAKAARASVLLEEGRIDVSTPLGEKTPSYEELVRSVLDMRELLETANKVASLDLTQAGTIAKERQQALAKTTSWLAAIIDDVDRLIVDVRSASSRFESAYLFARDTERKRRKEERELRKAARGEGFSPRVPKAVDLDASPVDWSTPATSAVLSLDEAASRSLAIQQQRASEPRSAKRTTSDVVQTLGDGSDIEDMAVNIVTGVVQDAEMISSLGGVDPNETGATTRYQFKLTAWAADTFYKEKVEGESTFKSQQQISVPVTGFEYGTGRGELGLWSSSTQTLRNYILRAWEASYGKDGSGTHTATVNIDGVDVSMTYIRARDRKDVIGKSYDGQVTIDVPAGTPSSVVSKAFQYMGVRNPSATTQEDIQLLVENRLLSVLAGDSDPTKYVSNPAKRAELLDRIFDKYGVRASDFEVRVGSTGRVEIIGPESLGKAIRNETEIDILLHTLSVENFVARSYDSVSDRLDQVMDGFANMLKPGQGLRSTTSRRLRGSSASGQSSTRDVETGGADYVYMSPSGSQSSWSVQLYGGTSWDDAGISVIYDPETMFRRIDWYANQDDLYGFRETPSEYNPEENFDFIVERAKPRSHEVMFKGDVGNDAIAFIVVNNKTAKEVLLTKLREKGVETINGQPIEVVVTYGIVKDRVALEGNKFSTTIGDREYLESVAGPL